MPPMSEITTRWCAWHQLNDGALEKSLCSHEQNQIDEEHA